MSEKLGILPFHWAVSPTCADKAPDSRMVFLAEVHIQSLKLDVIPNFKNTATPSVKSA